MSIERFEELPREDELGVTPVRPGPFNVALAVIAAAACAVGAAVLVLSL